MFYILPKYEILIYFIFYGVFVVYGIYNIYTLRDVLVENAEDGFSDGWPIVGRPRDDYDDEWENFKYFVGKYFPWYILHLIITESCRLTNPKMISLAHSTITLAFILASYNIETFFTISCQLLTFYFISKLQRKSLLWLLAVIWVSVIRDFKNSSKLTDYSTYQEYYELIVALSWGILKGLSFGLDKICHKNNLETKKYYTFVNYCGYLLYFPTFTYGPFMIFDRYKIHLTMSKVNAENFKKRFLELLRNIIRIVGWLLFTDFASHFIYANYMEHNSKTMRTLNSWGLYGFGYLMGQFFYNHYTVAYGTGISIAKFDQLNPPNQPKCIARIHLYSNMWKYFDQGLYEFLFMYIYSALCTKTCPQYKKMIASIITFSFIFVWHGLYSYILIWTTLNFFCLTLERIFKWLVHSQFYIRFVLKNLGPKCEARIYALLGTQVYIPSAISNFYFFGGIEVGNYFMLRTYQSGFFSYIIISLCCYCIFQCSEFICQWEKRPKNL